MTDDGVDRLRALGIKMDMMEVRMGEFGIYTCRCNPGMKSHGNDCANFPGQEYGREKMPPPVTSACGCPQDAFYHTSYCKIFPGQIKGEENVAEYETPMDAAYTFMKGVGLDPTPDAVSQLTEVFLPCLRIMCERPWDPNGKTWRKSGRLGVLSDARKKWERIWERLWIHGKAHDDSVFDGINYLGFVLRSEDNGWGEWGQPRMPEESNGEDV